jgi:thiamine biosynthesis lipoprotein
MGTVVSVDADVLDDDLVRRIERVFTAADAIFSLYRPDSELSRIAAGDLSMWDSSDAVRDAYALALEWSLRTNGAFTPNRPDGVTDLNGVVKALAMADAGAVIEAAGCHTWTLNVGGDILVSANPASTGPHTLGIVDPFDRAALVCSVTLTGPRRALATSGSAERGDHIWRGGTTQAPLFVQATVVANDIVTADVLATAIIAGGAAELDDITERWDVDVLAISRDGALRATPGFTAALGRSGEPREERQHE